MSSYHNRENYSPTVLVKRQDVTLVFYASDAVCIPMTRSKYLVLAIVWRPTLFCVLRSIVPQQREHHLT